MQRFNVVTNTPNGDQAHNIICSTGAGASQAQLFADKLQTFYSSLEASFATGVTIDLTPVVTEFNPDNGVATAFHTVEFDQVGPGGAGELLPVNVALLIRLATGLVRRGRRVQGRIFMPGFAENASDSGRPNIAFAGTVAGALQADLIDTADPKLAIWSRPIESDPRVAGAEAEATNASAWNQWAQQGRRRLG